MTGGYWRASRHGKASDKRTMVLVLWYAVLAFCSLAVDERRGRIASCGFPCFRCERPSVGCWISSIRGLGERTPRSWRSSWTRTPRSWPNGRRPGNAWSFCARRGTRSSLWDGATKALYCSGCMPGASAQGEGRDRVCRVEPLRHCIAVEWAVVTLDWDIVT